MASPNARGAAFALAGFAIFSCHDVVVKALSAHYSAVQIVFFSVLMALPFVTLIVIRQSEGTDLWPRRPGWTILRTAALVVSTLSGFYAFGHIPLTQAYAIVFTTPLIITVLSIPILGERVGVRRWSAVALGLAGVLIVLRPWSVDALSLGHFAALVVAGCGALVSVILRKIGGEERSVVLLLYPMLANIAIMGAVLPLVYVPMPLLHFGGMTLVALGALVAMSLMIRAYRTAEAVVVAPMQYSQMIWATAFGVLLFRETPDAATLVGSVVIALSGMVVFFREGISDVSETRPALLATDRAGPAPDAVLVSGEEALE
jgi:S-adenosylmethionine uptake transporter